MAFSPDGATLASGSSDTTALLWPIFPAPPKPVTLADLPTFWADLAADNAGRGYRAAGAFTASPREGVAFLKDRLPRRDMPKPERLSRLLADLDAEDFRSREEASKELEQLGELVQPALQKVLKERPTLETRRRIDTLLEKQKVEQRRWARAIQALEVVGASEARAVLESLAGERLPTPICQDATAALARLEKRQATR